MIDPIVSAILLTTLQYAICGSLAAGAARLWNRKQPGPRVDHTMMIGFLVGAVFGALFGMMQSLVMETATR